jgi:hypothetical protein
VHQLSEAMEQAGVDLLAHRDVTDIKRDNFTS